MVHIMRVTLNEEWSQKTMSLLLGKAVENKNIPSQRGFIYNNLNYKTRTVSSLTINLIC